MATFWEIAARSVTICSRCILSICNIYLFPVLILRAGFAFGLLQFLFISFLLLLVSIFSQNCRGLKKCKKKGSIPVKCKKVLFSKQGHNALLNHLLLLAKYHIYLTNLFLKLNTYGEFHNLCKKEISK